MNRHKKHENIRPKSNQPSGFLATVHTHKFDWINDIIPDELKLCPNIDQTGTYIYNPSKVV